jgi:hypothetical protein
MTLSVAEGEGPHAPQIWQPISQPANLISHGPVVQRIGLQFPKLTMQVRFLPGLPPPQPSPLTLCAKSSLSISPNSGAPFLRVLCARAGTTNADSDALDKSRIRKIHHSERLGGVASRISRACFSSNRRASSLISLDNFSGSCSSAT